VSLASSSVSASVLEAVDRKDARKTAVTTAGARQRGINESPYAR
jgi:hypothetical protein